MLYLEYVFSLFKVKLVFGNGVDYKQYWILQSNHTHLM